MAGIPRIGIGTNSATTVQLLKDGLAFDMSAATVKAVIVSADNTTKLSDQVTPLLSDTGADFATSLIVVSFASATKAGITVQGAAEIEVVVTAGGTDELFYVPIQLTETHII
tara:strand:+ start:832 stop:1167 length:336 start_codon:yes stop_codon:yes gene_type:complete